MEEKPIVSVTIRFPADLHEKVQQSAKGSMPPTPFNTEVVRLLYEALKAKDDDSRLAALAADLRELKERGFV